MQGTKQRSERNSPNRACMEIHHEFRAASKELEALQQLNKELWEMNMGLKEIKQGTWGHNTGLRDINQKPRRKKTFRVKNSGKQKEVQGNNKAMKITSNFTGFLPIKNVSPDSSTLQKRSDRPLMLSRSSGGTLLRTFLSGKVSFPQGWFARHVPLHKLQVAGIRHALQNLWRCTVHSANIWLCDS